MIALTAAALIATTPAWCEEARPRVQRLLGVEPTAAAVEHALAALPPPVADRARDDIGREGRLSAAVDAARTALRIGCDVDVVVAEGAEAEAQSLMVGPRFGGLRAEDNFSEKLKDRLWALLQELLESEGMQVFANNTRAIYLSALAAVCGVVAVRLLRRSRKTTQQQQEEKQKQKQEKERQKAFAAWRSEALPLIDDDAQARRALLLLRLALLSRVGEAEPDAVKPQRTSTEIVQRVPVRVADVIAPALALFDDAFYAKQATKQEAQQLLASVDAAAAALLRLQGSSS